MSGQANEFASRIGQKLSRRRPRPSAGPPGPGTPPALAREIGPWSLIALTLNCVVGAGVLGLPGRVFALAGPATPWVLGAAGALAAAIALCLAELAGRFDGAGGPALYLDRAFGPAAGFIAGWLMWAATVLGAASLLDLLAGLLGGGRGPARAGVVLLAALAMTVLAMSGARRSTLASTVLTVLKLAFLAGVAVAGLLAAPAPAHPAPGPVQPAAALVLVFFAFVGFERPTAVAGEVRRARASMPLALIAAAAAVALLYAGVFTACLRDLPDLARSDRPVNALALGSFGPAAAPPIQIMTAVMVLGTLASQWITAPRLLLALAERGRLPAPLARLHPTRRTPDLAILATGACAAALALGGGFVQAATASSAARLLVFIGCGAAMLRLRRMGAGESGFRLRGGTAIAAAVIVSCLALLAAAAAELRPLAVILILGGLTWLWTAWTRRRPA